MNPIFEDFLTKGAQFLIESKFFFVSEYSIEFNTSAQPRYKVTVISTDKLNKWEYDYNIFGLGASFLKKPKPDQLILKFDQVQFTFCGECGCRIFVINAGMMGTNIFLRDGACCTSKSVSIWGI